MLNSLPEVTLNHRVLTRAGQQGGLTEGGCGPDGAGLIRPTARRSPGLVLYFGPTPQGSGLHVKQGIAESPLTDSEHIQALQQTPSGLALSTAVYTCRSLRFVYSDIMGRVTRSWNNV